MSASQPYLIASRQGIFLAGRGGATRLVKGHYFGIACREGRVYAFVDSDFANPDLSAPTGQLVRFDWRSGTLGPAEVLVDGLHKEVHQLAFLGDRLFAVDTGHQRVIEFDSAFRQTGAYPVADPAPCRGEGDAYPNALLCEPDGFYVMLHNYGRGIASEIVEFDRDFRERGRTLLLENKCHDIVRMPDGRLLYCASPSGRIAFTDGTAFLIDNNLTRGLIVGDGEIVVGSSLFGKRIGRNFLPGYVAFLDGALNIVHRYYIPAAPTQICRVPV